MTAPPDTSTPWDGRPQNPERDGWHWLEWLGYSGSEPCGQPIAFRWETDGWWDNGIHRHAAYWRLWRYLGPCLTPDEARALDAERDALREALRKVEVATNFPVHKHGDTQFLRAGCVIAHSIARAALAEPPRDARSGE